MRLRSLRLTDSFGVFWDIERDLTKPRKLVMKYAPLRLIESRARVNVQSLMFRSIEHAALGRG
jgi:hypothetical protein